MFSTTTSINLSQTPTQTQPKSANLTSTSSHPFNKPSSYLAKYTLSYNDILKLNARNFQNYSSSIAQIAYTEEQLPTSVNHNINYSQLVNIIHLNELYPNNSYKSFIYKNHIDNNALMFNSNFESGNLRMAIKHSEYEYDLILRPETNSVRTFQWFYFAVSINASNSNELFNNSNNNNGDNNSNTMYVKFNIINLVKKSILFNEHVRVLCFYNNMWTRNTNNVYYYPNNIIISQNDSSSNNNNIIQNEQGLNTNDIQYHTLTFSFDFNNLSSNNNTVYFAYCYPYTYTHLSTYLSSLTKPMQNILRFENIGATKNGNAIHMLVITNFNDSFNDLAKKPAIIITGRVHPGESNSSYVVEGLIEFLLSTNIIAVKLRKTFIFKIIPMLNPDGVILGNFRMNTNGKDLNRMWIDADIQTSPSIYYTKQMIYKTYNSREIYLFCDFHGHSTKNNFFLYSCKNSSLTSNTNITSANKSNFNDQVFQYLFHKENYYFDKSACVNKINPSKIKTARAVLKNEFKVDLSYCLESSMGSIKLANGTLMPFTIELYKNIGKDFCVALSKMINNKMFYTVLSFVKNEKKERKKNKENVKKNVVSNCNNNNNNTSSSNGMKEILPYIYANNNQSPKFNSVVMIHNKKMQGIIQRSNSKNNVIGSNNNGFGLNMKLFSNSNCNYNNSNNYYNNNNGCKKYPVIYGIYK